jgi:translation initiation factor 2 beta subunit (eIF-2beta)/eIF-5
MMTPEMEKFIDILVTGDEEALVEFCKTLKNCPNCGAPIQWKNNQIYCMVCKEFGLREPSILPDETEIW